MRRLLSILVLGIAGLACLVLGSPEARSDTEPPAIEWVGTYGGDLYDRAFKIIQTPDSGYAFLEATRSFAIEEDDYYLVKLDQNGDTLWTRVYGEPGGAGPRDMINTCDGGLTICGNETTYDPDSVYFAMKTDDLGEPDWVRILGNTGWPSAVAQTRDSGFVFAGFTRYGTGPIHPSITKLNGSGDSIWVYLYGDSIGVSDIVANPTGGILVAGSLTDTSPSGVYLGAFDDDGQITWSRRVVSIESQWASAISLGSDRVILAGRSGWVSGAWVFDLSGTLLDSVSFGDSTETAMDVAATIDGGFVTCGNTSFSSPQPTLSSTRIRKFDRDLNQEWVVELDSTYDELTAYSIQQTFDGGYIFGGRAHSIDPHDNDVDLYAVKLTSQIPHLTEFLIDGVNPADHLTNHMPGFSWAIIDPAEVGQIEYEMQVGTDSHWDMAEMWETGVIVSSDTSAVYSGEPLIDGETYYLRLHVSNGVDWSPWYQTTFRMNSIPSIPVPLQPINDTVVGQQPTLWVQNSSDAEDDALTYDYLVVVDTTFGEPDAQDAFDVIETSDSTGWQVPEPLHENWRYWWIVRSHDGYEYSDWTDLFASAFFVDGTPEAPTPPTPTWPPDTSGLPVWDMLPTFVWGASSDPDPTDTVRYRLELAMDPDFTFVNTTDSIPSTEYTLVDSLDFATPYWWRVSAFDVDGHTTMSEYHKQFWTWTLGDMDHNHQVDIADLVFLVTYMFQDGPLPQPLIVADINGDCVGPDIADLVHLVTYMFLYDRLHSKHFRPGTWVTLFWY